MESRLAQMGCAFTIAHLAAANYTVWMQMLYAIDRLMIKKSLRRWLMRGIGVVPQMGLNRMLLGISTRLIMNIMRSFGDSLASIGRLQLMTRGYCGLIRCHSQLTVTSMSRRTSCIGRRGTKKGTTYAVSHIHFSAFE